ncbi:DUF4129 domain-containing protein [Aquibacillus rhizosphaerae]|uniref:DUF4129 domain-containing protein n=1 Tax=Aquibacillus rhizosphaerae TaxID=3051431 RepID=A0ABT7L8P7_9BACI|nr:DUF4129 domain-containing protein [Aquibacillus sp. LR5S19]MDL4842237.1 DUF4129 domain-containing protein [Aquibacillus sp. LR5S19]
MVDTIKLVLQKWLHGMIEYVLTFPLFLLIGAYFISESILGLWLGSFILTFLIGLVFGSIIVARKTWVYVLFSVAYSLVITMFFSETTIAAISTCIVSLIVVYRGVMHSQQNWNELLPSSLFWSTGFPVYFGGFFVFRYVDYLNQYLHVITWLGLVMVAITLFNSNNEHLKAATLSKDKQPTISKSIKRSNRIYMTLMFLIIILITNFQLIQSVILNSVSGVFQSLFWFASLFNSEPVEEEPDPVDQAFDFSAGTAEETSHFAEWIEKIMLIVVAIGFIIVAIVLLLLLFKRSRDFLKAGFQWLRQVLSQIMQRGSKKDYTESYTDEAENLIDWKSLRTKTKDRVKEVFSSVLRKGSRWSALSDNEKVRYLYRQLLLDEMKKGFHIKRGSTPHEVLSELKQTKDLSASDLDILDQAYGEVRYSNKKGTDVNIEKLSSLVNRLK